MSRQNDSQLVIVVKNLLIHFNLIKLNKAPSIDPTSRPSEFLQLLTKISGLSLTKMQQIKRKLIAEGENYI